LSGPDIMSCAGAGCANTTAITVARKQQRITVLLLV
jgi:hypothetical protein